MTMLKKFLFILFCISCIIFLSGCTSPYIGKSRHEIVDIIAQEHKKTPGEIYIYVPRGHNYRFNHPAEILNKNRNCLIKKFGSTGLIALCLHSRIMLS